MSGSRSLLRTRSLAACMTVIVSIAGLAAVSPGVAAAATPKCLGKTATIVGSMKNDVIRGTRGADVIVAKGGNDTIIAGAGNDLICAGGGSDTVRAGGGRDKAVGGAGADILLGAGGLDVLRGNAGNDRIEGGLGDDTIDGGLGFDTCEQGPGRGAVVNCEKVEAPGDPGDPGDPVVPPAPVAGADLSVVVSGPKKAKSGQLDYTVRVRNLGPDASAYVLALSYANRRATCTAPSWTGKHTESSLAAGSSRREDLVISCSRQRNGASVTVKATVAASVADANSANDVATARTGLR